VVVKSLAMELYVQRDTWDTMANYKLLSEASEGQTSFNYFHAYP